MVDLFENAEQAGASAADLQSALERRLRAGTFDRDRFMTMAARYGSRRTQALVTAAVEATR